MAESLYRKYRPQIFEDVVGQEHIERTLKNALRSDKVSHAYLFTGPRGTGKTTTARLLAKALLCEKGPTPDPDGTCEECSLIAEGSHPDVYELDAASRTGVENVREEIIGRVNYAPQRGRNKVYIIDEVHMLSTAAFNALLKTLEEPPEHVVFVLCTTDPQKVPETIHSRCQRFDFRRISNEELVSRLGAICEMEGIEFEGDALDLIAHRAQGGMRDAITSLEQLIAFGEGKVSIEVAERLLGSLDSSDLAEIVGAIGRRDTATCFRWTSEYMETGADLAQFTQDLAQHMRDMYVLSLTGGGADTSLDISESARKELEAELPMFGPERLVNMLGVLGDLASQLKTTTNQRLAFEIALTRMVRPESDLTLNSLAERIEALEANSVAAATISVPAAQAQVSLQQQVSRAQDPQQQLQDSQQQPQDLRSAAMAEHAQAPVDAVSVQVQASVPDSTALTAGSEPMGAAHGIPSMNAAANPEAFWSAAQTHIQKSNAAYGVLFMNAKAAYDEAQNKLMIEFPAEEEFAYKTVQKPEAFEVLKGAFAALGAPDLQFEYSMAVAEPSSNDLNDALAAAFGTGISFQQVE